MTHRHIISVTDYDQKSYFRIISDDFRLIEKICEEAAMNVNEGAVTEFLLNDRRVLEVTFRSLDERDSYISAWADQHFKIEVDTDTRFDDCAEFSITGEDALGSMIFFRKLCRSKQPINLRVAA